MKIIRILKSIFSKAYREQQRQLKLKQERASRKQELASSKQVQEMIAWLKENFSLDPVTHNYVDIAREAYKRWGILHDELPELEQFTSERNCWGRDHGKERQYYHVGDSNLSYEAMLVHVNVSNFAGKQCFEGISYNMFVRREKACATNALEYLEALSIED